MTAPELVSKSRCFHGEVHKYTHQSAATQSKMTFNIYLPDAALTGKEKVPVLYYLSGLTCNEDNMITKGGALAHLSKHQIALVTPDTSPRSCGIPGESDDWELGTGAGFYVDATQEKWSRHYNMYTYVHQELQDLVKEHFAVDALRTSVFGHSMGGHGALVLALRNPGHYRSVSGFAPICHPSTSEWGRKQFTEYLGRDEELWARYDATELVKQYEGERLPILIDQGADDPFYKSKQLQPSHFVIATESSRRNVVLENRVQPGYDHSYWFVQSFMESHIEFHAKHLKQ
ncbi:hypothetical protein EC988_002821 [Linderina pennispora]|nr:hypothetical protein EC988_002821 [Linderina pennispora]